MSFSGKCSWRKCFFTFGDISFIVLPHFLEPFHNNREKCPFHLSTLQQPMSQGYKFRDYKANIFESIYGLKRHQIFQTIEFWIFSSGQRLCQESGGLRQRPRSEGLNLENRRDFEGSRNTRQHYFTRWCFSRKNVKEQGMCWSRKQTPSHVFVYLINPLDPEVGSWTHYIQSILLSVVYKFTRNSTSSLLYS